MAKRKTAKTAVAEEVQLASDTLTPPQRPELVQPQAPEPPQLDARQPAAEPPARLPDAREMKSINLGPDKASPRLRLLRGYRFNQMQIRSDLELPDAARETLAAAGWTERREEGIWTRQLPPRAKEGEEQKPVWPVVVEAERLFHEVANGIRAEYGLPPVGQERSSAAYAAR